MRRKVRVALCGVGRMGSLHLSNLLDGIRNIELVGVYDFRSERVYELAKDYSLKVFDDYAEVVDCDEIDGVLIATPTAEHLHMSVSAAKSGKHVFCEKPLALTLDETRKAASQIDATGVVFQVGFHRRFDPDWRVIHDRVRKGELGDVILFKSSLRDMKSPGTVFLESSGGCFVDFAIHDLDCATWINGEIVEVSAHGTGPSFPDFGGVEDLDNTVIVLKFSNGGMGIIDNARTAVYGYEASAEIMGSKATARIGDVHLLNYTWRTPSWVERPLPKDFQERFSVAYRRELEAFADSILAGEPSEVGSAESISAIKLAAAAEKSWKESRIVRLGEEDK